jgi:hypothetical protein
MVVGPVAVHLRAKAQEDAGAGAGHIVGQFAQIGVVFDLIQPAIRLKGDMDKLMVRAEVANPVHGERTAIAHVEKVHRVRFAHCRFKVGGILMRRAILIPIGLVERGVKVNVGAQVTAHRRLKAGVRIAAGHFGGGRLPGKEESGLGHGGRADPANAQQGQQQSHQESQLECGLSREPSLFRAQGNERTHANDFPPQSSSISTSMRPPAAAGWGLRARASVAGALGR